MRRGKDLRAKGWSLAKSKNSSAEHPKRTLAALSKHITVKTFSSVAIDICNQQRAFPRNKSDRGRPRRPKRLEESEWEIKYSRGCGRGAWNLPKRRHCGWRSCSNGKRGPLQEESFHRVSRLCRRGSRCRYSVSRRSPLRSAFCLPWLLSRINLSAAGTSRTGRRLFPAKNPIFSRPHIVYIYYLAPEFWILDTSSHCP